MTSVANRNAPLEAEGEALYGLDEPCAIFPRAWSPTRSKAAYQGWRQLSEVGMVDSPFDPRAVTVRARFAYRVTADPFAEITHHTARDAYAPGAWPAWVVRVEW